jgi:DMSO/TMAO reductase YedYZ molybdopterin-dependent catalytic subunit
MRRPCKPHYPPHYPATLHGPWSLTTAIVIIRKVQYTARNEGTRFYRQPVIAPFSGADKLSRRYPFREAVVTEHPTIQTQEALVTIRKEPFNAEAPLGALRERITPSELFYVRNNFAIPDLALDTWRLQVDGAVEQRISLTLDDLKALPQRTVTATMECAGNGRTGFAPLPTGEPWGLGAVSTAIWRGAALSDLLPMARLRASAIEILFEGADSGRREGYDRDVHFARSLPLAKAFDPDTLLAYEFNGLPLPADHGGPVRLLVPDWYGMASVKWVVRIAALEQPFVGHFQTERYVLEEPDKGSKEPVGEMHVKSLITGPVQGDVLSQGPQIISGAAWSGAGTITQVEVSVESERGWQPATLIDDPTPHAWRRWEYRWAPQRPGRYVLRAKATDEKGNTQPDVAPWNTLGYVNNSIQYVIVEVIN